MTAAFEITPETVCTSAPGKVILFGEHAVVYGHTAIAAALSDLRIFVWITPCDARSADNAAPNHRATTSRRETTIRIMLPDLSTPIDYSLPCQALRDDDAPQKDSTDNGSMPASCWTVPPQANETAATIARHLSSSSTTSSPNNLDDFSRSAVTPILYLFKIILDQKTATTASSSSATDVPSWYDRDWQIYVRSQDLPVGAGLGSSAAFSVALAAALLRIQQQQLQQQPQGGGGVHNKANGESSLVPPSSTPVVSLDTVNQYAYYAEILLHGHPSGLDNAVATYGGALQFHKTGDKVHLQPLAKFAEQKEKPLDMLLVHTHIPRSTKALVAKVRALYERYPQVVQPILESMGEIAKAFANSRSGNRNSDGPENDEDNNNHDSNSTSALLDWVRLNHALLRAVGVSHPSLDALVQLVDERSQQQAAAKLTGAGGGGCALVVWSNEGARAKVVQALSSPRQQTSRPQQQQQQQQYRYSYFSSIVGGKGVQWHDDPEHVFQESSNSNTCDTKQSASRSVSKTAAKWIIGTCFTGAAVTAVFTMTSRRKRA